MVTRLGLCPQPELGMGTLLALALRKRKVGFIHLCRGDTNKFEHVLGQNVGGGNCNSISQQGAPPLHHPTLMAPGGMWVRFPTGHETLKACVHLTDKRPTHRILPHTVPRVFRSQYGSLVTRSDVALVPGLALSSLLSGCDTDHQDSCIL